MVLTFDAKREALSELPEKARFAFAAKCASRALAEATQHSPSLVASHPSLEQGVDILWRAASNAPIPQAAEIDAIHRSATDLIPASERDPRPERAFLYASKAVGLGLGILLMPDDAPKLAALCGGAMTNLVSGTYKDEKRIWRSEQTWQQQAIELLQSNPGGPFAKTFFDAIPEYERGPVVEPSSA